MWKIIVAVLIGILIGIIVLFNRYANSAEGKGKLGEADVANTLNKLVNEDEYLINDLIIKDNSSSGTHQIDHILISRKGVFVIETKNYAGMIYGNDNDNQWTQVLAYGNTKNRFYSPVKQNMTHVHSINRLIRQDNIFNIVIFVKADISNVTSDFTYNIREFKSIYKGMDDVLTIDQIQKIYNILMKHKEDITTQEHVGHIKEMENKIENNICPRCGGKLVLREGKNGKFYGCSNYPRCKFTKKYK